MRIKILPLFLSLFFIFFHLNVFSQSIEDRIKELQAELIELRKIESSRPRKTIITGRTRVIGQAMYLKVVESRIEQLGTAKFPIIDGRRLYGELIVSIPIFQDGSIFEKDGGPKVEKSSGDIKLDESALNIVRQAAPFDAIPNILRSKDREDVWVIVTNFNFTNKKVPLEAEVERTH